MSTVHVRDARADDEPALARIFQRASLSNAGDRGALLADPEALEISDDLVARGRTRVATFANGVVVGFASTRPTDRGVLELDDLFVDPDAMRRGVARQLIRHIATEAATEDVVRIDVTANPHALGFYEAVGFVVGAPVDTRFGPAQRMHLDVASAQRTHLR
jgi:ribosomal protein S18 acetylase RimI-like enzyme